MAKQDNYISSLFVSSDINCRHNALIYHGYYRDNFGIMGYKDAADILVERVLSTEMNQDTLIYPIGFLYRHYLELLLKNIIVNGSRLAGNGQINANGHKLDILWANAKSIIHDLCEDPGCPEEQNTDNVIAEFMRADASSQEFRYEKDKKGNKCLKEIEIIDIKHFSESINQIGTFLEGISALIDHGLDNIETGW